ncbi:Dyp-type peroxidase [Rhodococcus rhodochrous]|uniref:Dyp-type peroxidase n=1 Tax=Rhodococcus rhodochrous TaxID=1829 RepID=A0AA46WYG5_RHORH|nr:Dyp-type peroxidase [Rhodococcus rhodochrous]MCB8910822.1 Dyp-type peroxidase [Rhodococcus rhodochrous]MCD2098148.1 Dyp-type peroxidase [Rhodococcus rhodochrous]MCD2122274.1 Dyp-type peroxidase [Rhodococcus rhodochrous]MCQ4133785.1 Dyp-type peroxidase [Rhodococcus rhodochrous]MDJ0019138.1 Dyp-type peroxidase [Rhodococcus rhodochrous]
MPVSPGCTSVVRVVRAQPILTPLTEAAIFLVVTVDEGAEDTVRDLLEDLSGLRRSVGFRIPEGGLSVVTGIGSDMWDRLFDGPRPAELHPFVPLDGGRHQAPSTPGDLLFHLRASTMDLCFELAAKINDRLRGAARVVDETHGFRYFERRDLLGFVDGTENPEDDEAVEAALVSDEDPDFAGGSYVIVQKYLHDLASWNSLTVEEQERAIGRTKLDDIELDDETKPANSHVALNVIVDENGIERQIVRANMPFGSFGADEFGTYFIGYSATPEVTEQMLRNMFLGSPPGNTDRILDFSTAVTGSLFFCPSLEFLEDLPPSPADNPSHEDSSASTTGRPADGSLGIGALRRSSTL